MVGDSELADVQGAKQMGMYAALVTDEASPKTQADCFTNHNDMANDVTRFVEHQH
jgi:FMN phosphatase YigB (HAD superfamily)